MKTKSFPSVASVLPSIFHDDDDSRRRPVLVRTGKSKEFLNKHLQDMLYDEGIKLQVCKNPEVKYDVVEHTHRTIRERLYKYFIF